MLQDEDRNVRKLLVAGLLAFLIVVGPELIPPDAPVTTPIGSIKTLEVQETTFSTSTTVITEIGAFHVQGAVSGHQGDRAVLKVYERPFRTTAHELCIESIVEPECYALL